MEVRCSLEPVDVLRKNLLSRKVLLDSTSFCLKTAQRVSPYSPSLRVSPYFLESERNLTLSLLGKSDKLVIGQHLLLSPAKYSGESSMVRICSSSRSESGGGVAMLSAES